MQDPGANSDSQLRERGGIGRLLASAEGPPGVPLKAREQELAAVIFGAGVVVVGPGGGLVLAGELGDGDDLVLDLLEVP